MIDCMALADIECLWGVYNTKDSTGIAAGLCSESKTIKYTRLLSLVPLLSMCTGNRRLGTKVTHLAELFLVVCTKHSAVSSMSTLNLGTQCPKYMRSGAGVLAWNSFYGENTGLGGVSEMS